ncbi:MAG: glycine oxidase ThiO [Pseudomonadota bacterium]|nr:glycine oxidase ThiO [Pseudomonadota bacterium]
MPEKTNTLIIGGGIIGLLTARELAISGQTVTILEKNAGVGQESSWAGGGILSPLYPWRYPDAVTELAVIGHKEYPKLAADLLEATGIDPEYVRSGHLILDTDEYKQAKSWAKAFSKQIALNKNTKFLERIGRRELSLIEPELSENYASALWMPMIGQIRNPRLIQSLIKDLLMRGVKIIRGAAVKNFYSENGKVVYVETANAKWSADNYLVAAGAWTSTLLSDTGLSLDIEPVRGQMILFRAPPDKLHRIILNNSKYLIPRRDGHILAGSTMEYVGFENLTTDSGYQELWSAAVAIAPFLKNTPVVNHWAGLRPGSSNGIPTIDRHPDLDNLIICSGHFRNGVIIGLGSARIAAGLLTGSKLPTSESLTDNPYRVM